MVAPCARALQLQPGTSLRTPIVKKSGSSEAASAAASPLAAGDRGMATVDLPVEKAFVCTQALFSLTLWQPPRAFGDGIQRNWRNMPAWIEQKE
eukprot:3879667-Rhodomonas_salina.1